MSENFEREIEEGLDHLRQTSPEDEPWRNALAELMAQLSEYWDSIPSDIYWAPGFSDAAAAAANEDPEQSLRDLVKYGGIISVAKALMAWIDQNTHSNYRLVDKWRESVDRRLAREALKLVTIRELGDFNVEGEVESDEERGRLAEWERHIVELRRFGISIHRIAQKIERNEIGGFSPYGDAAQSVDRYHRWQIERADITIEQTRSMIMDVLQRVGDGRY